MLSVSDGFLRIGVSEGPTPNTIPFERPAFLRLAGALSMPFGGPFRFRIDGGVSEGLSTPLDVRSGRIGVEGGASNVG